MERIKTFLQTKHKLSFKHHSVLLALLMLPGIVIATWSLIKTPSGASSNPNWTSMSTINEHNGTQGASAVWTGSKWIFWGGFTNSGSIYDPGANSWKKISTISAPSARSYHVAVWTGSKMIVWGGLPYQQAGYTDTGGIYDPETDTWMPTSAVGAPEARYFHAAVWTGSKMIVWGGFTYPLPDTGGKMFDPLTNTWTPISTANSPNQDRIHFSSVWTGSKMIVWGGYGGHTCSPSGCLPRYSNDGGIYDVDTNSWTKITLTNAPEGRMHHSAVWTGSKMIVYGGLIIKPGVEEPGIPTNTGGVFDPSNNTWGILPIQTDGIARERHTAVWTGSKMIIWGGSGGRLSSNQTVSTNTGFIYDPVQNISTPVSPVNAPSARLSHRAQWTGNKMLIWGGLPTSASMSGGIYSP